LYNGDWFYNGIVTRKRAKGKRLLSSKFLHVPFKTVRICIKTNRNFKYNQLLISRNNVTYWLGIIYLKLFNRTFWRFCLYKEDNVN